MLHCYDPHSTTYVPLFPLRTQCHKSHVFFTWRRRYEEATGNRSSNKGQIKLLEYSPPAVQPGLWQRIVASHKSLLVFGPQNPVREFCQWLTSSETVNLPSLVHNNATNGGTSVSDGGNCRGVRTEGDLGRHIKDDDRMNGKRAEGCWRRFLRWKTLHRVVRFVFESVIMCAVVITLVVVSLDSELASGRRTASDDTDAMRNLETVAVTAFLAEAILLSVARGLVLLPNAYLRDSSDIIRCLLTALSAVSLWAFGGAKWGESFAVSVVKAMRALNVVRLLKLVPLSRGLVDVLKALRSSGRALCLAGGITLFFWLQWSIIGLQVWVNCSYSYFRPHALNVHYEKQPPPPPKYPP